MLGTQGDLEADFVLTGCSLPLYCIRQAEIQQEHDIPLKRFDGNLRTECNMGNTESQSTTNSGFTLGLIAAVIGGAALLHDWDSRQENTKWHGDDIKAAFEAEKVATERFSKLSGTVENIQKSVVSTIPRRQSQPLVFANAVNNERFELTKPSGKNSVGSGTALTAQSPVITIANFGDYSALDVSVVWMIEGQSRTVAIPNVALRVGQEISTTTIPFVQPNTEARGYLQYEYGDSDSFRGKVRQPFFIKACQGHVHLTVYPHEFQSWKYAADGLHTN